jgi:hypothetical protein
MSALDGRLTEEPFAHGLGPLAALDALRDQIARSHGVTDPDARRRLLKLNELSREWIGVLGTRHRKVVSFWREQSQSIFSSGRERSRGGSRFKYK